MSTQITLTVSDSTYQQAEHLARQTGRDVNDVLATTLEFSLYPFLQPSSTVAVKDLPDDKILEMADGKMDHKQNSRMDDLLSRQQAEALDEIEKQELALLLYLYQQGSLLKARALGEAIRRGLRPFPQP